MHLPAVILSTLLAVNVADARGERQIDQSRPANRDARVEVENISGSVTVVGWSGDEVRLSGTITGDIEEVEFTGDPARLHIKVIYPKGRRNIRGDADIKVEVPFEARLDVQTVSADIRASEINGPAELQSVSGEIELSGNSREVELQTVSGDIRLHGGTIDSGRFNTVSGDIEVTAGLGSGRYRFESVSGDIELDLPSSTGAQIEYSTFSGSVGGVLKGLAKRSGFGDGTSGEFTIGDGSARIKVSTFSGDLDIRTDGTIQGR